MPRCETTQEISKTVGKLLVKRQSQEGYTDKAEVEDAEQTLTIFLAFFLVASPIDKLKTGADYFFTIH